MNHFKKNIFTSPLLAISSGYIYIALLSCILYTYGFYEKSNFFEWGVPVIFMGKKIENNNTFYMILFILFLHQIINNWINSVTYPWIINCVQDPKSKNLLYPRFLTLFIVNMFALYSEIDVVIIISSIMSQVSFFISIILANIVSTTFINWQYVKKYNGNLLVTAENSTDSDEITALSHII